MKAPAWLWGLVIGFGALAIWNYGNARAADALATARADSLATAAERHDALEVERDAARADLAAAVVEHDRDRDSLINVAGIADLRSRLNLAQLADVLHDSASVIPDTVRIIVTRAIKGLEAERNVCRSQLSTCEVTRLILDARISADSASLNEKDGLLVQYQVQLKDAIAHRRRPAGVLQWAGRVLEAYAIFDIIKNLLGDPRP